MGVVRVQTGIIRFEKRDGRFEDFDILKIATAMQKAFGDTGEFRDETAGKSKTLQLCIELAREVEDSLLERHGATDSVECVDLESVQDEVERVLMHSYPKTAKAYILYRKQRESRRDAKSRVMRTVGNIIKNDCAVSNLKRENANIDAETPMGTMLKVGSEASKGYYTEEMISDEFSSSHVDGYIHIHDLDFFALTATCCQIDTMELFKDGFGTGHGFLREPNDIASYSALAAIAIQGNQNDMHGGQSIPNFDHTMAIGVRKTFRRKYVKHLQDAIETLTGEEMEIADWDAEINEGMKLTWLYDILKERWPCWVPFTGALTDGGKELKEITQEVLSDSTYPLWLSDGKVITKAINLAYKRAMRDTDKATFQAMEALVHNLNTMHSRAGAQVPFSSINYGTNTTEEGRMVIRNLLKATMAGLGAGETAIFPIQIFRVQKGVNYYENDPNYDLFKLALECSAKRMFPNFAFQDAWFNKQYLKEGDYRTEIAYMGCRTRVIGNVYDPSNEIVTSRGNLSFTSINLPRLAIEAKEDVPKFFSQLTKYMELVKEQLLERFAIQCGKIVRNYPFLMGQGIWLGSNKLDVDDCVGEIFKHGSLSIGFIGIAETLTALIGEHHGESEAAQKLGLEIVTFMRDFCDKAAQETKLNFTLLATPAESLAGRFVELDRNKYGKIAGVTDKEFYTNSFHIPVYYPISAYEKITLEAPYHELTNAGHITYVELDGDASQNLEAMEAVVKCMCESGCGYGAVNHPIDRDPDCGYNGVIANVCPRCGRTEDEGRHKFERIRRITGYLVGTLDRFNNAKRTEERMRVKHVGNGQGD